MYFIFLVVFTNLALDIDECDSSVNNHCDENADCTNIISSYTCDCKPGYTGNGRFCESKLFKSIATKQVNCK